MNTQRTYKVVSKTKEQNMGKLTKNPMRNVCELTVKILKGN